MSKLLIVREMSASGFAATDEVGVADTALHVAALGDDQAVAATAVLRVEGDLDAVEARGGQRV